MNGRRMECVPGRGMAVRPLLSVGAEAHRVRSFLRLRADKVTEEGSMAADWYYIEEGKSVGPVSTEEIIGRIRKAKDQPLFVWTAGMSEWTDAHTIPQFSAGFQMEEPAQPHPEKGYVEAQQPATGGHATLAQRARHEVIAYLAISGYLLVWFSAVMFYKATILGSGSSSRHSGSRL
jgi:hypothetical protein